MSHQRKSGNNGNCKNVADLEKEALDIENNLVKLNKSLINRVLKGLSSIMYIVQRKEGGIFKLIVKWFRLYLQIHISIIPDDKLLLKYYENTVPTAISYIIGCLQYKTKEVTNYHLNLLEILEDLLKNIPTYVFQKLTKFEIGTIGCLWQPIDLAGDFNTQLKALKILSQLLKHLDETRQNEELKSIKWTNLNLFQDKLKTIVQETKLQHVLENNSRDLLNNYNMNLSKNILVYSFYCLSVILDCKYKFYKPLNHEKFWIDINYRPQTLSYKARFKLNRNSNYEEVSVILKIESIKLENNMLTIHFKTPAEFSKYSEILTNNNENIIQFKLNNGETQRFHANDFIIEYFNSLEKTLKRKHQKTTKDEKNSFDLLKNQMATTLKDISNKTTTCKSGNKNFQKSYNFLIDTTPESNRTAKRNFSQSNMENDHIESPKTSRSAESITENHPIRKLRERKKKFFTSLLEEDPENEIIVKKRPKRRTQNKKTRQSKSHLKQVCKVTPTVDLTKVDQLDTKENQLKSLDPREVKVKKSSNFITSQECTDVLQQVADIYNVADTSYAKPCQSYRNFKIDTNRLANISNNKVDLRLNRGKNKIDIGKESLNEKKRKVAYCMDQDDKENINPENPLSKSTKRIISPHLFETQRSAESSPPKIPRSINNKNMEIDLTIDEQPAQMENHDKVNQYNNNYSLSSGSDCEEVRGLNEISLKEIEHICTPTKSILNNSSAVNTPTPSAMNVSELNDSDMEITQIVSKHNFFGGKQNEQNNNKNPFPEKVNFLDMDIANINDKVCNNDEVLNVGYVEIENILKDFDYTTNEYDKENLIDNTKTHNLNDSKERDYHRDCVVFRKRLDSNDTESSEEHNDMMSQDFFSTKQNLAILNEKPMDLCHMNAKNVTADKDDDVSSNVITTMTTKCQVTPTAIIMHQIQVSAKKSVIYRGKNVKKDVKVNKCLNDYYKSYQAPKELSDNIKQTKALQNHKSNEIITKENLALILPKVKANNSSYDIDKYHKTYSRQIQKFSKKPTTFNSKLKKQALTLPQQLNVEEIVKDSNIENDNGIVSSVNSYIYDTPSTNSVTEELFDDIDENLEDNSSHRCSYNNEKHFMKFLTREDMRSHNIPYRNMETSFKNDIIQILNQHNTNIQLRLNNFHQKNLKDISSLYTRKFCEIVQGVLRKSDEQRIELEQIRQNIGRLVRELQGQYDEFINKYKEFDVHKELTERVLETITNLDITYTLNKDYEEELNNIYKEQQDIVDKLLQTYLEKQGK